MAKSIRSKVMRRHRSVLRKTVCEPMIQKRQEQLSANLLDSIQQKSGKTIANLKAVFHPSGGSPAAAEDMEQQQGQEEEVVEEEEEVGQGQKQVLEVKTDSNESKKKKNQKMKKVLLNEKSRKPLVWFT